MTTRPRRTPTAFGRRWLYTDVARDDAHGSTSFAVVGGPKRYLVFWDHTPLPDWSWIRNEHARIVKSQDIRA